MYSRRRWRRQILIQLIIRGYRPYTNVTGELINSLRPGDTYIFQPSSVHIMACRLVSAKPLSKSMQEYFVNWTLRNKLQWNFNRNTYIFLHENALENVICETAFILSRPQPTEVRGSFYQHGLSGIRAWISHYIQYFTGVGIIHPCLTSTAVNLHKHGWVITFGCNYSSMPWTRFWFTHRGLAPVPLSIFRSNSKFDENSKHSSVKYTRPITTICCTHHDSVTVVTCTKYRCDRSSIFETRVSNWITRKYLC